MAAAEQEISPMDNHQPEQHDTDSSTLNAPSFDLENYSQSVMHEIHQLLVPATSFFIISRVLIQFIKRSEGEEGFIWRRLFSVAGFSVLVPGFLIQWRSHNARSKFVGLAIYRRAAFVVLQAYALLLLVDARYIRVAIIALIILIFVAALCVNLGKKIQFHYGYHKVDNKSYMEQMKMQGISQSLQLFFVIITLYEGQEDEILIMSHFLLFFSTALSALAVMVASLPVAICPGVENVLPILRMVCISVLLVTVHTNAAKWLGKDIIFACMPELAAVLVWFTIQYDNGAHPINIHDVTSRKSEIIILGTIMVIMAYHASVDSGGWNSIQSRALHISCSSSALSYFSVWMLHQWPEGLSNSKGPIKLLKFSAKVCFYAMFMLAVLLVGSWIGWPFSRSALFLWVIVNVVIIFLADRGNDGEVTSHHRRTDSTSENTSGTWHGSTRRKFGI